MKSLFNVFWILLDITLQIVLRSLNFSASLTRSVRHLLITSTRSIQSATSMLRGIIVSQRYWYLLLLVSIFAKISQMNRCAARISKGSESAGVMIFDHLGSLLVEHSFQHSFKILENNLHLGIVIAIARVESLKTLSHC